MKIKEINRYGTPQFLVTVNDKPTCSHEWICPIRLHFKSGLHYQSFGLTLSEATEIADGLRDAVTNATETDKPKTENEPTQ